MSEETAPVTTTVVLINQSEVQVTGGMPESVRRSTIALLTADNVNGRRRSTTPPAIIQVRMGRAKKTTSPSTHIPAILELSAITVGTVRRRGRLPVIIQKMDLSIIPATVVEIVRIGTSQASITVIPDIIPRRSSATQMAVLTQDYGEDIALKSAMPLRQSTTTRAPNPNSAIYISLYSSKAVLQSRKGTLAQQTLASHGNSFGAGRSGQSI